METYFFQTSCHYSSPLLKQQVRAQNTAVKVILLPDPVPGLQFERLDLQPQALMIGTPHSKGTREYFTCTLGRMVIFVDGHRIIPWRRVMS